MVAVAVAMSAAPNAPPHLLPQSRLRTARVVPLGLRPPRHFAAVVRCRLRASRGIWRGTAAVKAGKLEVVVEEAVADGKGDAWSEFVERVSGEWDGYGAEFSGEGEAVELPFAVVPQAFRDWDVQVYDWQTQCPTLAGADGSFWYKLIRLLPTVGCEADAATQYCLERRSVQEDGAHFLAFLHNGSYTAVWPGTALLTAGIGSSAKVVVRKEALDAWEVEHCFCFVQEQTAPDRRRFRLLQQLSGWKSDICGNKVPALSKITLYAERWDGPFRNGESLGGCGANGSGFATSPRLDASCVRGNWSGQTFSASASAANITRQLLPEQYDQTSRGLEGLVTLPNSLWSQVKANTQGGFSVEAGWLVEQDKAVVSTCNYTSSGELQGVHTRYEQRIA